MTMHFISGFPRAGSSLLASLLSQNPRFHASFQSPVGQVVTNAHEQMSHGINEGASAYTREQRVRTMQWLFAAYYAEKKVDVIFDNNRRWCANMALLDELFPSSKVIACVRDPRAVIDSFERVFANYPSEVSRILKSSNTNIYDRVESLLAKNAICGFSFNAFREAYFGQFRNNLLVVDYDDFAQAPKLVLEQLHAALGEEPFDYDIDHVETLPGVETFDKELGTVGLHKLKPKVVYEARQSILPPDIFERLPQAFWKTPAPVNEPITPTV